MSLGSYIQWRLFDPDTPPPRRRGKTPVKDHVALSKALAALGQSRIASNLNQIARAIHTGGGANGAGAFAGNLLHGMKWRKLRLCGGWATRDYISTPAMPEGAGVIGAGGAIFCVGCNGSVAVKATP